MQKMEIWRSQTVNNQKQTIKGHTNNVRNYYQKKFPKNIGNWGNYNHCNSKNWLNLVIDWLIGVAQPHTSKYRPN